MKEVMLLLVTDGERIAAYRPVEGKPPEYMQKFYQSFNGQFWDLVLEGTSMGDVERAVLDAVRAAKEE